MVGDNSASGRIVTICAFAKRLPFHDSLSRRKPSSQDLRGAQIAGQVNPVLVEIEAKLGRKISLTVYRPAEFRRKLEAKNSFLMAILEGPKVDLIGVGDE